MSDIIRMLRVSESDPVQQEAADEIERLRAELAAERERAKHWMDKHDKVSIRLHKAEAELTAERGDKEYWRSQQEHLWDRCRKAEAERDALRALLREARDALKSVLIGGNHLALLIGADHPLHTATHEEASKHYSLSRDTYEIWCCWRTMMHAGPTLARIDAALKGDGDEPN